MGVEDWVDVFAGWRTGGKRRHGWLMGGWLDWCGGGRLTRWVGGQMTTD